ncbi:CBS domain-containing protein [Dongia sp.]|uniref:CBS domain-containing protein n=1 Tax=Dongia sp. TaxID=1977262 RepID=UPI0035B2E6C4
MTVASILKQKPNRLISVGEKDSLADVAAILTRENIGAVTVLDGQGEMVGIVSERDLVRQIAREGAGVLGNSVASVMTKSVVCCTPEDSIEGTMALMTERRFRHLPVRSQGRIIGMISIGDVVKRRVEDAEREAASLRDYIVRG